MSDAPTNLAIEENIVATKGRSLWVDARDRLMANKAAVCSLVFLILVTMACFFGPWFTSHQFDAVYRNYVKVPASLSSYPGDEQIIPAFEDALKRARVNIGEIDIDNGFVSVQISSEQEIDPRITRYLERSDLFKNANFSEVGSDSTEGQLTAEVERLFFLFGTDSNGRDLLTRTLVAGRVSLVIGLLATFVAITIGVFYGALSGYFGGRTDLVMMRIVDILYSLPFIFFVIMLVVFFGRNFVLMFIAVGAVEWLDMARIVRGQTLTLKRQEYVQAAEAMGVGQLGILKRHIIPNTFSQVVIYMTLLVPRVILLESFLSFLGLGVQEPMTSWGVLIAEGAKNLQGATWMLIFPAIFLISTLFALNFIGDGLRDALDPKDR